MAPTRRVTVAVVDDHDVVLSGVRAWIDGDPRPVEIVDTATSIDGLDPRLAADVLVIDPRTGGEPAFARIAELAAAGHRIVVFSQCAEADLARRAELAGASAFVRKESGECRRRLVEAILAAAAGEPGEAAEPRGTAPCRPQFSEQELRTMRLWLGGLTRAAVARKMGISEHTVKQYLARAREKYARAGRDASNRIALYREARRDGLLDD
ncbi:helix-turn-helix transcriptional regulator [Actinomadura verrucosospora]|uniref:Two component LuxR family transcriptional regulator n=1 Tax=Actinomadura verrucosospora TaxID=46165 RepID=A0A7D3VYV8_ACTVE|nr:LuxR C-terminal-related transcriptional regulator [Actinomadura verrucosospora]QKG22311.1 two component LuxR family transcriptional regulator [Actinomadura verrucosospora]